LIECAGCKERALYEVYKEERQPHCLKHMLEAIACSDFVYVKELDEREYENASKNQLQRKSG